MNDLQPLLGGQDTNSKNKIQAFGMHQGLGFGIQGLRFIGFIRLVGFIGFGV